MKPQIILHPNFKQTLDSLKGINLKILNKQVQTSMINYSLNFPSSGIINVVEAIGPIRLNPNNGASLVKQFVICGYDESTLKYLTLEGNAHFTSHSMIILGKTDYYPVSLLTFNFYSRSKKISQEIPYIKFTDDSALQYNYDYVLERSQFLNSWAINKSLLLIDGPLIGGNISSYTISLVKDLHKKNIIPVFIVKNSESNLVTDNIEQLKGSYNSDMHWSYNMLKRGSRTNFFKYEDPKNTTNSKVFCYIKPFDLSPQRIEFYSETFYLNKDKIDEIMDLLYYLFLVQGNKKNPQIRPILIAEMFARKFLSHIDSRNFFGYSKLIPTINQERFGG